MISYKRLVPFGIAMSLVAQGNGVVMAAAYDALCNEVKCKIVLDGK